MIDVAPLLRARRSTSFARSLMVAILFLFSAADARSGDGCGFPWTIFGLSSSGGRLAISLCGVVCGCTPHDRQVSVVGSEIRVTYTQGEAPNACSCVTICYDFRDTIVVEPLSPGEYTVIVTLIDCAVPTVVGTQTVRLEPSAAIPTLDLRGALALAILLALVATWRLSRW